MRTWRLFAVLVTLLIPGAFSFAQTEPCGDIITPAGFYGEGSEEQRTPIENCDNPFNKSTSTNFTSLVKLGEQVITGGDTIEISPTTTELMGDFQLSYPDRTGLNSLVIYKRYGQNYLLAERVSRNGRFTWDTISSGQYVAVVTYDDPPMLVSRPSRWQEWLRNIIPTAHAFDPFVFISETKVLNFSVVVVEPPPPPLTGASSVLFLPGILGSRLYEESDACAEPGDALQKQRWVSTSECDQLRMVTDVTGASVNNLYTYTGKFGLADAPLLPDIYASFVQTLEKLKESNTIQDFSIAPYDWRLNLDSILRSKLEDDGRVTTNIPVEFTESYLYRELERLASESLSGKVTIVAHSNGGMVAKQLLLELERLDDPLLEKVDNLILVAVPQVGTPDAVWALLHGTELGYGLVMSNEVSRQLLNTMSFAHHLLPNDNYFSGSGVNVSTPVIFFEDGELTSAWRNQYGDINNRTELHQFLDKNSGRVSPEVEDLLTPEIVDPVLLDYAEVIESLHGNWTPPQGLSVYQIAGTGLDTPSGITYFTDRECVNRSIFALFRCTEYRSKLGYRVNTVIDGDKTVVTPSAVALRETASTSRWWLNLNTYNASVIGSSEHKNIFEVKDVRKFISDIVQNKAPSGYDFLAPNPPDFSNVVKDRLIFQLHSPLDLVVETQDGVISSSTITAKDSVYRHFGELQYISVPANAKQVVVRLQGLAQGSFTLDVETARNGEPQTRKTFSALPTSTSTQAVMVLGEAANLPEATLEVDYDGNGVTDVVYTEEGEVETVSYETLKKAINNLPLRILFKTPLLVTASLAERYSLKGNNNTILKRLEKSALIALKGQLALFEKKKIISKEQREELVNIITVLINRL
jgi:pimeloyl-ACP methyl ester carboxylesterase